ncbi:MAG: helix-turn-helix transcriptional regulator [Lachnospiraceae bacterium]|nr:helix-turn-helix transcriptional regulator [Lachnospiraceae bacterium]
MTQRDVGERIKLLRESNNYTRDGFAEKVGISPKFLYEIEMGRKGFSADTLVKISKAVSVSCDYIMLGTKVNSKVMDDVVCELEGFRPEQMGQVRDILKMIKKLNV